MLVYEIKKHINYLCLFYLNIVKKINEKLLCIYIYISLLSTMF